MIQMPEIKAVLSTSGQVVNIEVFVDTKHEFDVSNLAMETIRNAVKDFQKDYMPEETTVFGLWSAMAAVVALLVKQGEIKPKVAEDSDDRPGRAETENTGVLQKKDMSRLEQRLSMCQVRDMQVPQLA